MVGRYVKGPGIKQELGTKLLDREQIPRKSICVINSGVSQDLVIPQLAFPHVLPQEISLILGTLITMSRLIMTLLKIFSSFSSQMHKVGTSGLWFPWSCLQQHLSPATWCSRHIPSYCISCFLPQAISLESKNGSQNTTEG